MDINDEEFTIKCRKIPNQNIVYRLRCRETHNGRPGTHYHRARKLHTNVFPNFTMVNIEKPPCFLRKFSPDGRYFTAFSSDQMSLEIYEFQGSSAAESLLTDISGDYVPLSNDQQSVTIRGQLFSKFFNLKHVTVVVSNGEHLNRECSLFTDDGRYIIVGSASYVPEDPHPYFFDVYRNNESVTPNPRSPLEDYSLHIIDLKAGQLTDSRHFKHDKIFLSHNQGIYLYHNTLAVLSVQQQSIHIFHITPDGFFVDVRTIGRFCYEDDEYVFRIGRDTNSENPVHRPYSERCMNSLKHRLLAFLFRKAQQEDSPYMLRRFYQFFYQFKALRMWKMQLLDENHVLVKYASEDVVTLRISDPNSQPSFFVIYNISTTEILSVYENTSEDLLELFENFCDLFRNATLHNEAQFPCSASSNLHARQIQQRFKQTIINAKFGGQLEAVKRLLSQLPISSQSYSSSPYLDLSLYSYDDKWVSVMERPKTCGDHPIRFYARDSSLLKFKIYPGVVGRVTPASARRLVAFTFHPFEPFAISVQRTNAEYIVNFHIRHVST